MKEGITIRTNKFFKIVLAIMAGLALFIASDFVNRSAIPATFSAAVKNSDKGYDAQIVSPSYNIRSSMPTDLKNMPKVIGTTKSYNNQYVRVMKIRVTNAGAWAYIRYYGKYVGWVSIYAIKEVSLSTIATQMMKKYDAVGTMTLISAGTNHTVTVANGYANKAQGILNETTGKVIYPLASLQKSMTGAIVQQLIDSGQISLKDTLDTWYPSVKYADKITIKEMLTMTSGIQNDDLTPKSNMTENQAYQSMLSRIKSDTPGTYHYSDANYVFLAGIIAKVTGQSYETNLKTRILDKLGMTNTFIAGEPMSSKVIAQCYEASNGQDYAKLASVPVSLQTTIPGAGNLYTTAQDYLTFQASLTNGKVLTSSELNEMLSYSNNGYSGGFYTTVSGNKHNLGSFGGTGDRTFVYSDINNYHGSIGMLNQTPLANNTSVYEFSKQMYQIAKYY